MSEVTDDTPEERAAEIEREFDAMMVSADKLQERIDREERAEALMAKLQQPDTSKIPATEARSAPAVDNGLVMDYRTAFAEMISRVAMLMSMLRYAMFLKNIASKLAALMQVAVLPFLLRSRTLLWSR